MKVLIAGRPMDLEAVAELGERLAVPMPHTRSVYARTSLLGKISRGVHAQ